MKRVKRFSEGDEVEYFGSAVGSKSESAPSSSETKAAPKNRVVTKEELKASGMELRDFLNKERGLTRRDEPASKPAPKSESKPTPKAEEPAKPAPKAETSKRGIGPYNVFSGPSEPDADAVKAAKAAGDKRREKQASEPMFYNPLSRAVNAIRERGKKSNPDAYAKGGSVSSASKRGDGIAQRGKTRGKMC
jgi:hypothetical protein